MSIVGIIPARWGATRFEGKLLAQLDGKPILEHVWQQSKKCLSLRDVIIATDDERIQTAAEQFGAVTVMTSGDHLSGTDRIGEVAAGLDDEIIINIQGDEPLINPGLIDGLGEALSDTSDCVMATAIKKISDEEQVANPNVVKVVIDCAGNALYFSRSAVPFYRQEMPFAKKTYYKHIGLYAYRREFLLKLISLPVSFLEASEKLEQLRVIEAGYSIKTIQTEYESISVDTPDDLQRIKEYTKGDYAENKNN